MKAQTHHHHVRVLFAIAVFTVILTNWAWGAEYTAIDLHPSGFDISSASGISGTQQVGSGSATGYNPHALLWSGTAASYVDLTPSGSTYAVAWSTNGTQQVGFGYDTSGDLHAFLWSGTAESCIDLNPSGFYSTLAYGISGTQQVGYGSGSATGYNTHALLWSGSAASCVDLNPSGFDSSYAMGTNGTQQVGYAWSPTSFSDHALLWSDSADSFVDLHPSGFDSSSAYGIGGTQQVGSGDWHALLWYGTAESYVDLHPSGFDYSTAVATNGIQQVGYGLLSGGTEHALLWSGSAASFVDLHQFLPSGFTHSGASGIDAYGNIVGYAYDSNSGYDHAFLWQLVTETDPIQEILDFIEESVSDGTLVPVRTGPSGNGQLGALVNMIEAAGKQIKKGHTKGACGHLHAVLKKTDGQAKPPDFVTGPAATQLAQMIQDLRASLGCK